MDYRLEHVINGPAGGHPFWDTLMTDVANWAVPVFAGIIVVWFAVGWIIDRPEERRGALTALLAAGAALLVNQAILLVWERPRPFVAHPATVHTLVARSADGSFPSDHAAAAAAIAGVLFLFHRRLGAVALGLTALLCVARVYVGAHYPGDVAVGAIIGLVVGAICARPLAPVGEWIVRTIDRAAGLVGIRAPARLTGLNGAPGAGRQSSRR